jgi:hypothetical protein
MIKIEKEHINLMKQALDITDPQEFSDFLNYNFPHFAFNQVPAMFLFALKEKHEEEKESE